MKSRMDEMAGRVAAVLLVSAGLAAGTAVAQTDSAPPPPSGQMQGQGGPRGQMVDPERRTEMLQKQLSLSDDQAAQVKAVLQDSRAKMQALMANTELAPQDRRTQNMALRRDQETKLEAIFTPDQKAKYEDIMAQERARMQQQGGGPGGPPPPPPALLQ